LNPSYIIQLIQTQSKVFKLEGGSKLKFIKDLPDTNSRFAFVSFMLEDFAKHQTGAS